MPSDGTKCTETRGAVSEDYLQLLPTDPAFIPSAEAASAALQALESIAPESDEVEVMEEPGVAFVDAGENFSAVRCPACGAELEIIPWWQGEMDRAFATRFQDLSVVPPCCRTPMTLNDLDYDWPQGFARWWLRARNPNRYKLQAGELAEIASAVEHPLREVWTHY